MICDKAKEKMNKIEKEEKKKEVKYENKTKEDFEKEKYFSKGICWKCGGDVKESFFSIFTYHILFGFKPFYTLKCRRCKESIALGYEYLF